MSRTDRRGFITLEELIVVAPLVLLLIGLIGGHLMSATRRSVRLTTQAQLQEAATMVLQALENDLSSTPAAGVSVRNAQQEGDLAIVTLNRLGGLDPSGVRTCRADLLLYVFDPSRQALFRREWSAADLAAAPYGVAMDPLEPFRPAPALMRSLALDPNSGERKVSGDVALFEVVSKAPEGFIGNPLTVRLVLERKAVARSKERCELRRTCSLMN